MSISNVRFTGYEAVGPGKGCKQGQGCNAPKGNKCGPQDGTGPKSQTGNCPDAQGTQNPQQGSKFSSLA
ncbi:MAG: hypothetical protein AB7V50_03295 [Vampirovibrionia bacterium]